MDDMIRRIGLMLMAGIALCAGPLPTAAAADATRYGYTAKYMGVPEGLSSQRAYKVCCDADGAMLPPETIFRKVRECYENHKKN